MSRRLLGAVLAALLAVAGCGDQAKEEAALPAPLPELVVERLDGGGSERSTDWRGKVLVLNIWATYCAPCRHELPSLQRLADGLDPARYAVIGVSIDDNPLLVREYLRTRKVTFARHIDRGGVATRERLAIKVVPTTLVIDTAGQVVWSHAGDKVWDDPAVVDQLRRIM